jgi:protein phosphatase
MGLLDVPPLAAGATDIGHDRSCNEDRFGVFPDLGLFVVVDGMSGALGSGEVVAAIAIEAMREHFEATREASSRANAGAHRLAEAVRLANRRILERAASNRMLGGACCTLVALSLAPEGVHVTHVGDSRVYRIVGDGLEQLTVDHTLENDAERLGYSFTPEQMSEIPRNVITRAVGLQEEVAFEVQSFPSRPRDVYLLCSDGLHEFVPPDEITAMIGASPDLDAATQSLVGRALHHDASDNITCVLVVPERRP